MTTRPCNLTPERRALARRSRYMTDRYHDLRAVVLDQLDDAVALLEDAIVADFPDRARESGITSASRIANANPRVLLRELEEQGKAFRHRLATEPGGALRTHWSLVKEKPPQPSRAERIDRTESLAVRAARRDLAEAEPQVAELEARLKLLKAKVARAKKVIELAGVAR